MSAAMAGAASKPRATDVKRSFFINNTPLGIGHLNEIGFYPNWREASVARGQLIDLICPFAGGLVRAKIPFVGRCPLLTFCGGTSALFAARKAAIRRTCSSRRPGRCFHAGRHGWR